MRKTLVALGAALLVGMIAAPALAHVTVQPDEAPTGAFFKFAIRVPNERDVANSKISVTFPENLIFVSFQPKEGWSRKVTMKKLEEPIEAFGASIDEVVDTVTWTGGPIGPGEFDEFYFSAKVPDEPGELEFSADQTYDDGEVVTWQGTEEEEHPSPRANVVSVPVEEGHGELSVLAEAMDEIDDLKKGLAEADQHMGEMMAASDDGANDGGDSNLGVIFGIVGIALGATALAATRMQGRGSKS